ncbi:MAG: DUF58 domain-containing protein [Mucinivorans sp.]
MNKEELLKKVRRVEIKTRGLSNDIFAGKYHSAFKGRGMAFSEVRDYRVGDDVRDIDWNVTARHGKPHIKVFEEERELTLMLLVDLSASNAFGTTSKFKRELATEIAAVLAFSAASNNDKIGCVFFTDRIEQYIPPKKGRSHVLRIISELLEFEPTGRGTDLSQALEFFSSVQKKRCTAFLISDFSDFSAPDSSALDLSTGNASRQVRWEKALLLASARHDMIGLRLYDEREKEMPKVGIVELRDAESGVKQWVDTSSRRVRDEYAVQWVIDDAAIETSLHKSQVDAVSIATDEDYVMAMIRLFKMR